jgi:hypothetical protein
MTLDELIAGGEEHANKILIEERHKELKPMFHLVSADGKKDALIMTSWADDFEKKLAVAKIKQMSHEMGAVACMFMTEAWMLSVKSPPGTPNTPWHRDRELARIGRPSQSPDRIEVVIIVAGDGSEQRFAALQMIRDKPGGRLISLVKDHNASNLGTYESWMLDGMIKPRE